MVQLGEGSTNPAVIWQQILDINLHQHTLRVLERQLRFFQMDFQHFHKGYFILKSLLEILVVCLILNEKQIILFRCENPVWKSCVHVVYSESVVKY